MTMLGDEKPVLSALLDSLVGDGNGEALRSGAI
jgi:hypothetical protein